MAFCIPVSLISFHGVASTSHRKNIWLPETKQVLKKAWLRIAANSCCLLQQSGWARLLPQKAIIFFFLAQRLWHTDTQLIYFPLECVANFILHQHRSKTCHRLHVLMRLRRLYCCDQHQSLPWCLPVPLWWPVSFSIYLIIHLLGSMLYGLLYFWLVYHSFSNKLQRHAT